MKWSAYLRRYGWRFVNVPDGETAHYYVREYMKLSFPEYKYDFVMVVQ